MAPRVNLLIACVQLLGCHLLTWRLLEGDHDVPAAVVFLGTWGLCMWLGYRANRIRIRKPRKKKAAAPADPATEAS
jgi:hypothetical protein